MSVRILTRVWDFSRHSGTELLMLLAIADFADDDGNAYPAVPTLAKKCRMGPRNANFILKALKASGELQVQANEGPKGTNRYRIVIDPKAEPLKRTSPPKKTKPLKPASPHTPEVRFTPEAAFTPEAGFPKPLKPASDEPSLNRKEEIPEAKASALPPAESMSAKDKVWKLGPGIVGGSNASARKFIGKLLADNGGGSRAEGIVAQALEACATSQPGGDVKGWLRQACKARASRQTGDMLDRPSRERWSEAAGFATVYEAESAGCNASNFAKFREGRRIPA